MKKNWDLNLKRGLCALLKNSVLVRIPEKVFCFSQIFEIIWKNMFELVHPSSFTLKVFSRIFKRCWQVGRNTDIYLRQKTFSSEFPYHFRETKKVVFFWSAWKLEKPFNVFHWQCAFPDSNTIYLMKNYILYKTKFKQKFKVFN